MHLAYCSDIEAFHKDQLRDQQLSYRFPGSGWVTCLYRMAKESGIDIVSGDIAIKNIFENKWLANDVYVIQEMDSREGSKLLSLGANAFLITCLEAPIYAPFFYDNIDILAKNFQFSLGVGFSEAMQQIPDQRINLPFRFPSFYLEDMREISLWNSRKKMVLVAANKYKTKQLFFPGHISLKHILRQLKSTSLQARSATYKKSLSLSLHNQRLEAIAYFITKVELDLYGSGWNNFNELPAKWVQQVKNHIRPNYLGLCKNKLATISHYQFSICFENMIWPGYITEKIIDCFVAGSIPLYLGAPDIDKIIPKEAFIDMRNFSSFEQAADFMNSMTQAEALDMINAGRKYLQSEQGRLHSYEGFAKNIMALLLNTSVEIKS